MRIPRVLVRWLAGLTLLVSLPVQVEAAQVGSEFFAAGSRLVNFDSLPSGASIPNGAMLANLYSDFGVLFGDADCVSSWAGIPVSLPNRAHGSPDGLGEIDCYFPDGVVAVGAWGFDFALEVFDEQDHLIEGASWTDGTPGIFSPNELAFVGVAAAVPVYHARFSRYWSGQVTYGFEIDDLKFVPLQPTATRRVTWGSLKPPAGR